jgi:MFS transporter, SP family, inositol transporter
VLWCLGPLVVLLMSVILAPLGVLGIKIVFAHLLALALLLTLLRSRMQESRLWTSAKDVQVPRAGSLLEPRYLKSMAFLVGMYGIWNLSVGTLGSFLPYILRTVGGHSQEMSLALQGVTYPVAIVSVMLIFMRWSDRANQRLLFGLSIIIHAVGMLLLVIFPLTVHVVLAFIILAAIGSINVQAFYQLWSAELFPTLLRSTAQGITFAVVRIGLGLWTLFVPAIASENFAMLALALTGFLMLGGLIGVIGAPRNEGKSLEEIEADREAASSSATIPPIPVKSI